MAKVFKQFDGVIKGKKLDTFEFGDLGLDVDNLPILDYHEYPKINQGKYTYTVSSCTIAGAYKEACYLRGLTATQDEMLECVIYAHENDNYQYGKGRWADLGMRSVEKFFEKKYPDRKLYYSTIRRDDPSFWKLLKKGYMIGFTYDGNYAYNKDYQGDAILDGNKFGARTYGHRTSLIYRDGKLWVVDSYAGTSYNVYEVKDFNGLIQNAVYDEVFFVFTKEAPAIDPKELSRCVKLRNLVNVIKFNSNATLGITKDDMFKREMQEIIVKCDEKIKNIDLAIQSGETLLV